MNTDKAAASHLESLYLRLRTDAEALDRSECFALVDWVQLSPASREGLLSWLESRAHAHLYRNHYHGQGLEEVDPLLIELPLASQDELENLVRICQCPPALTFLSTACELFALCDHVRQQLEIYNAERQRYIARWSDAAALQKLHEVLDQAQRQRVMTGIRAWYFLDRAGDVQSLRPPAETVPLSPAFLKAPLRLTASQQKQLEHAGRADEHLTYITEHASRFGALQNPARCYQVALEVVKDTAETASWGERNREIVEHLKMQGLLCA